MSDHYSDSSKPQPKPTLEESSLNFPPGKETIVEANSAQPNSSVEESNFNTSGGKKTVVESNTNNSPRNSFVRKDTLEGKTIGDNNRYLLQTLLGQGGMSKVYRALDTKFEDKIVAIKVMTNYAAANNKNLIKRFMGEIKWISRLKHPNIIQILDYGVTPKEIPFCGSSFYVMEYFSGNTLQNLLTENKTLPVDGILKIIRQVCAGLQEAHKKGIVHRDLKPDNIFLVTGGAFGEIVKIIDFGIAKNINPDRTDHTNGTAVGSFIGTYRYASPEQCKGLPTIDHRTDIYSLGVILYEAICGNNPYNLEDDFSTTQADWIACHIRVPPKPLKEQLGYENIDENLENIVMKCLAKKPADRFSDIEELQNALVNISANTVIMDEPVIIDPPTVEEAKDNNHHDSPPKESVKKPPQTTKEDNKYTPNTNKVRNSKLSSGLIVRVAAIVLGLGAMTGYLLLKPASDTPGGEITDTPEKNTDINIQPVTDEKNLDSLVKSLENQYDRGDHENCYQSAINSPDRNDSLIQTWIGKCGLSAAQAKAEANSFVSAIAIAKEIPNTVPNYQEIENNINVWSEGILSYADTVYKEEGIDKAIEITKKIPDNSTVKAKVDESINQWKATDKKYQDIITSAQKSLKAKAWFVAERDLKKIPADFKFWTKKAKPILEQAEIGIKNWKPPTPIPNTDRGKGKPPTLIPNPDRGKGKPPTPVPNPGGGKFLDCSKGLDKCEWKYK